MYCCTHEQKFDKSIFIEGPDNLVLDGDYIWATELNHQAGDSPTCIDAIACSLPFSIIKINKTHVLRNRAQCGDIKQEPPFIE